MRDPWLVVCPGTGQLATRPSTCPVCGHQPIVAFFGRTPYHRVLPEKIPQESV